MSHLALFFFSARKSWRDTFFFFNDTATTEIYTLSLHDALPIYAMFRSRESPTHRSRCSPAVSHRQDRKSTRLNSSHSQISYAVFCLKKKKQRHDLSEWTSQEEVIAQLRGNGRRVRTYRSACCVH